MSVLQTSKTANPLQKYNFQWVNSGTNGNIYYSGNVGIECSYCINMIERKNIEITHNGFVYCSVICAYNDKYCYSDTQYYHKRHLRLMKEN